MFSGKQAVLKIQEKMLSSYFHRIASHKYFTPVYKVYLTFSRAMDAVVSCKVHTSLGWMHHWLGHPDIYVQFVNPIKWTIVTDRDGYRSRSPQNSGTRETTTPSQGEQLSESHPIPPWILRSREDCRLTMDEICMGENQIDVPCSSYGCLSCLMWVLGAKHRTAARVLTTEPPLQLRNVHLNYTQKHIF